MERAIKILLLVVVILLTTIFTVNLRPGVISYSNGDKVFVKPPSGLYFDPLTGIGNAIGINKILISNSAFSAAAGNYNFNIRVPNKTPNIKCPEVLKPKEKCSIHTTVGGIEFTYFSKGKTSEMVAKLSPENYLIIESSIILATDPIQGLIDKVQYVPASGNSVAPTNK